MPRALGGSLGASKARDRAGTKTSDHTGDPFLDDFLGEVMDPKSRQKELTQLNIINQFKGLIRNIENCSLTELLEQVDIADSDYLEMGKLWRKLGSLDEAASLRQTDQFIYVSNLLQFLGRVNHIFKVNKLGLEKMMEMNIPVMGFYYGITAQQIDDFEEETDSEAEEQDDLDPDMVLKVHRLDVTLALLKETPIMSQPGYPEFQKRELLRAIKDHLHMRYPTRELLDDYIVFNTNSLPEKVVDTIICPAELSSKRKKSIFQKS